MCATFAASKLGQLALIDARGLLENKGVRRLAPAFMREFVN
jgi:hypothetical protein